MPEAQTLDQLAARLGRPVTDLAAFGALTPEQVGLLCHAIDEARARRRREVEAALAQVLPSLPRAVVLRALRRAGR